MAAINDYDYAAARQLVSLDVPFDALVMAAMMRADTENLRRLELTFPTLAIVLRQRHASPADAPDRRTR